MTQADPRLFDGTRTFTVADPRFFDGDPFEVAERAVLQAGAVAAVLKEALEGARIMARNAELERELIATGLCDGLAWDDSLQGRKFAGLLRRTDEQIRECKALAQAAGFNPKARV